VTAATAANQRIDWVDYAKGICIILVVMMHSTLGVQDALGQASWVDGFIHWAKPFRMPDFFLISGLFLASRINRPWRAYADTKILHFGYFYLLWMTIQAALKGWQGPQGVAGLPEYWLTALVEPLGTLWFIYVLMIFFVAVKLLRHVPVWIIWPVAAALEMAQIHTGWIAIDESAHRFVYFYSGYVMARYIMNYAAGVSKIEASTLLALLASWAVINHWMVEAGTAFLPGLSIMTGFAGCAAVITVAQLMSRVKWFNALRYCGENTLPIYLAFFVFMAASRIILIKTGIITDGGTISLMVTTAGVIGPLVLHWIAMRTPARFLFVRPAFARLIPGMAPKAAESLSAGMAKPV
jgi:uncharacterized membrane protein YcfT